MLPRQWKFVLFLDSLRSQVYEYFLLLSLSTLECSPFNASLSASYLLYSIVIVLVLSAVGKSSLLTRFTENTFLENYAPTIGIDYSSRMIRVDRAICKLEIWDTAGTASRLN